MTIAVHISLSKDPKNDFNYKCFSGLAVKYPEHHFIFIFDRVFDPAIIIQKNIIPVVISPQIKNRLLSHYWYNFKLPKLLNKYHAAVFTSNGINCSLRTTTKQCMILEDISFLQKENLYSRTEIRYLKKYFKNFVLKANCIAVTNEYIKHELVKFFPDTKSKINTIGYGLNNESTSKACDEIQTIKDKYTAGKEFFISHITDVSESYTLMLLKAFSAFKKRQLSNMQLVLLLPSSEKENPVKDFSNYKYRDEVKIIFTGPDEARIISAAYAYVYLPSMYVTESSSFLALENNIPVITLDNEFCKTIYGKAALYSSPDEKNIAQHMMLIYKDEHLRNELIRENRNLASSLSFNNTTASLWQAIQAATEQ